MCKPLREKLKKDVIYEFGPVEQLHFKKIKEAMSTRMNLVAYSPERFTRLYHNACDTGLAYMLVQRHDEEECWCQLEGPKCFSPPSPISSPVERQHFHGSLDASIATFHCAEVGTGSSPVRRKREVFFCQERY